MSLHFFHYCFHYFPLWLKVNKFRIFCIFFNVSRLLVTDCLPFHALPIPPAVPSVLPPFPITWPPHPPPHLLLSPSLSSLVYLPCSLAVALCQIFYCALPARVFQFLSALFYDLCLFLDSCLVGLAWLLLRLIVDLVNAVLTPRVLPVSPNVCACTSSDAVFHISTF